MIDLSTAIDRKKETLNVIHEWVRLLIFVPVCGILTFLIILISSCLTKFTNQHLCEPRQQCMIMSNDTLSVLYWLNTHIPWTLLKQTPCKHGISAFLGHKDTAMHCTDTALMDWANHWCTAGLIVIISIHRFPDLFVAITSYQSRSFPSSIWVCNLHVIRLLHVVVHSILAFTCIAFSVSTSLTLGAVCSMKVNTAIIIVQLLV